jgi:hypothetical protein
LTKPHGASANFDIVDNLGGADYAVHEWIGLLAYRLAGKSQGV